MIRFRSSALLLVGAACALLSPAPALAGIGAGNWEAGFAFGGTRLDSDVADENGSYFDVRGGYFLSDRFELEGQVAGADADVDGVTVTLLSLFANAVFNFNATSRVTPYVLVGIGSTNLEYEFGPYHVDDDATSYQAAIGMRYFVGRSSRTAVRFELSALSENTFDERSTHYTAAIGLTWRIGRAP